MTQNIICAKCGFEIGIIENGEEKYFSACKGKKGQLVCPNCRMGEYNTGRNFFILLMIIVILSMLSVIFL